MTAFSLTRVLLLAVLATAGVNANPCGKTLCDIGLTCCNSSCGICVKPGMKCTTHICPDSNFAPREEEDDHEQGVECGPATCKGGTECCNESCGYCVEPGKGCTQELCLPAGEPCGDKVCAKGLVCCNESCGLCAPPNGGCTQQLCIKE
ncbi:hypothetical protein C7999DRAFT_39866 [Corynascus novoguineensis]|uniref:Uncharacterized protein n=1 Tax=Corynascus novoguineensis TaxID=1126955 RepID=A0AAN7HGK4_9PEZI|nr:hypothetical protein C7999DRAFT_39866 [Corynascus novoguineensis]